MKLRKVVLVLFLALLLAAALVMPAAAGKTVTEVVFAFSGNVSYEGTDFRMAGPIEKWYWVINGDVSGDALVNGRLSWEVKLDFILPNAHTEDYHILWMPGQGKWRLEVEGGGWEGATHLTPWVISDKWPLAVQMLASGTGFGVWKNTRMTWSLNTLTPEDPMTWTFYGQISQN